MILNENQIKLSENSIFLSEKGLKDIFKSVPVIFKKKKNVMITNISEKIDKIKKKFFNLKEDMIFSEGLFNKESSSSYNEDISKILNNIQKIEQNLNSKDLIISKQDDPQGSLALYAATQYKNQMIEEGLYSTLLTYKRHNDDLCSIYSDFIESNGKIIPLYSAIVTHKVKDSEIDVYYHIVWRNEEILQSNDFPLNNNLKMCTVLEKKNK